MKQPLAVILITTGCLVMVTLNSQVNSCADTALRLGGFLALLYVKPEDQFVLEVGARIGAKFTLVKIGLNTIRERLSLLNQE